MWEESAKDASQPQVVSVFCCSLRQHLLKGLLSLLLVRSARLKQWAWLWSLSEILLVLFTLQDWALSGLESYQVCFSVCLQFCVLFLLCGRYTHTHTHTHTYTLFFGIDSHLSLFIFSFGPHFWYAEVPRPRVKPPPQQWQHCIFNLLSHQGTPKPFVCLFSLFYILLCLEQREFWGYEQTDSSSPRRHHKVSLILNFFLTVCPCFMNMHHTFSS